MGPEEPDALFLTLGFGPEDSSEDLDESTGTGTPRAAGDGDGDGEGEGEGMAERSRSEGSNRSRSSKFGNRKEVSEWALRWWDPLCGVSGIWSIAMSVAGGGFPANFASINPFSPFSTIFSPAPIAVA